MTRRGLPSDAKFLNAFIRLSNELNVTMREDALVKLFSDVFEELLPGRLVSIRLINPENSGLQLVYANGRLNTSLREEFHLTQDVIEGLELNPDEESKILAHPCVIRSDSHQVVFDAGIEGFAIALCDRKEFYGMLNFEYAKPGADIEADRRIALPLAHQMTAALRNTKLISETLFLKDYLEKLLDHANAPVLVCDPEGKVTVVNQTMERLTGYRRDEVLGDEFMSLVPETDRARLLPFVINAMRGEPMTNIEVRIPTADSTGIAHIAFNTAAITTSFGEVEGVIFVGQDLTEVRNLQKQIIHTEKLATLGQVAAGVAHELNNPLTSITAYANYLLKKLDGAVEESDHAKIRRILNAAERIQSFTRDLVTYARPSGEEPTLIRIDELIERALSFCEHMIGEYEASVSLDIRDGIGSIYGIRGQLEQVFVNLITNSCHALPIDGGSISIFAAPKGTDQVEIEVSDTGHGIAPDALSQIFEPFFTTKDQGEGTGLGLSIVRNIIDNHDGEISVKSEIGKGTTFVITLYAG